MQVVDNDVYGANDNPEENENDVSDVSVVDNEIYGTNKDQVGKENAESEVNTHLLDTGVDSVISDVQVVENDGSNEALVGKENTTGELATCKVNVNGCNSNDHISNVSDAHIVDNKVYGSN